MAKTRAQENRKIRQEALRDQLSAQGHLQHILDITDKLQEPDNKIEPAMVARYDIVIKTKIKLLAKYLPDLKAVELTGPDGGDIGVKLRTLADFYHEVSVADEAEGGE